MAKDFFCVCPTQGICISVSNFRKYLITIYCELVRHYFVLSPMEHRWWEGSSNWYGDSEHGSVVEGRACLT